MPRELIRLEAQQLQTTLGLPPPSEILIFAFGKTETRNGVYVYDEQSAELIRKAEAGKRRQPWIDYEHQSLEKPAVEAPAAALFDLDFRPDGLYAVNIRWRPRAEKQISGGEYLFYSPAFYAETETGRVVELINIGLTNDPAIKDMRPMVAARAVVPTEETAMSKTVFVALTGRDDADEAAALAAAMALTDLRKEIITLTGKQSMSEALGVLHANSVAAAEVVKLSAEVEQLRGAQRQVEVDKLVDDASRAGKVPPAKVEALKALGKRDLVALRETIELLPVMPGQGQSPRPAPASKTGVVVVELSASDREAAKLLGVKPDALKAHKAKWLEESHDEPASPGGEG